MSTDQLENALALARDAYEAFRWDEATSFYNIALTVDPGCAEAKIGKGCAILRPFSPEDAAVRARKALEFWREASVCAGFSGAGRDMIAKAAIERMALWLHSAMDRAEAGDTAGNTADDTADGNARSERIQKEIALWTGAVSGIAGMSENIGFLKNAMAVLEDAESPCDEISGLSEELGKKLFFAGHPYLSTIRKAEKILPERRDYDGRPQFGFPAFSRKKYECRGKIDIQREGLKINDIRLIFEAGEDSVLLSIQNETSIRVEDPEKIERLLGEICAIWRISSEAKSVTMKTGKEYRDGEVYGALDGIHAEMDGILREGEKILDLIAANGGKQGLFASIFGKKK
jgi:hypothetical protein